MRTSDLRAGIVALSALVVSGCGGSDPSPEGSPEGSAGSSEEEESGTGGQRTPGGSGSGGSLSSGSTSGGGSESAAGGQAAGGQAAGGRAAGGQAAGGTQPAGGSTSIGGASQTGGASSTGGGSGTPSSQVPQIGGCALFTADDAWNTEVYEAEADPTWTARLHALVGDISIHPDFGGQGTYGIPINVVPESQPLVDIVFDWWPEESDPGPYPFPPASEVEIEGHSPLACDGDCHLLVIQQGTCRLYEGYACQVVSDLWHCGNGATWDLTAPSYGQRPEGWTSADAAGLAITPGILRYAEVAAGAVRHAIRFTVSCTTDQYVRPATHFAVPGGCDAADPNAPPMGLRIRLARSFETAGFRPQVQTILTGMQHYGLILADNGSDFYFQGDADPAWDDADLDELKSIAASAFEVVAPVPALEP